LSEKDLLKHYEIFFHTIFCDRHDTLWGYGFLLKPIKYDSGFNAISFATHKDDGIKIFVTEFRDINPKEMKELLKTLQWPEQLDDNLFAIVRDDLALKLKSANVDDCVKHITENLKCS
jgi:secreted Zn-dependent insulinase-like peptidase